MPASIRVRPPSPWILAALLAGLGLGVACKDGGGSNSPASVQGSGCPQSLPRNGAACPRGAVDFCVYRGGGAGDHACTCGKGGWRCAKK